MVALDITLWGTRETLLHEMSHVIDNKFGNDGLIDDLNEKWAECNPPGFDYYYNYFDYEGDTENTSLAEEYWVDWNPEIVYFYDDYAKTYPGEDRARVMEHFTDWDTLEDCYSSSHLQKKIGVYLDFLEAHFESCQDGNYLWRELYNQLVTGE
jgi:hypothetical protein